MILGVRGKEEKLGRVIGQYLYSTVSGTALSHMLWAIVSE
jgi:hypothetical protein